MTDKKKLQLIEKHLDKSVTYDSYKKMVEDLLNEGKSTGLTQNETYLNYSKLGLSRMKRWEKTAKLTERQQEIIKNVKQSQTWLVIAEGWCGDAAPVLPILQKIADLNDYIDFKVILRDENDDLMQAFLTNGGKSIPKLIAFNLEQEKIFFTWGPRPFEAAKMVAEEKEKHGVLSDEFKTKLQQWYNKDKGENISNDLIENLKQTELDMK
ncbi:thioredoxin family protein [Psychroflexus aestuariivivens]|uniref:thioredoxin family protein n=1 Tax=Psychroflexus aestuariivivens TaxID=1795040 RepID=UPI000FDB3D22|nr:thioredoxin family protein [Psychroflexus aestuariivivens]